MYIAIVDWNIGCSLLSRSVQSLLIVLVYLLLKNSEDEDEDDDEDDNESEEETTTNIVMVSQFYFRHTVVRLAAFLSGRKF